MPRSRLAIPLNCPKCPHEMIYITSTGSPATGELDTHFYRCPEHGGWKVLPNGQFVPYSFTN